MYDEERWAALFAKKLFQEIPTVRMCACNVRSCLAQIPYSVYKHCTLQVNPNTNLNETLQQVVKGETTMNEAVGPAVGCLMATFGTNMISSCIFDFDDPEDLK